MNPHQTSRAWSVPIGARQWRSGGRFFYRRLPLLVLVTLMLVSAAFVWHMASGITAYEEWRPSVAVESVQRGRFLGLDFYDHTRDQYSENAWLRHAMNEGFTAASAVRRFQMDAIHLYDGQHPATGEPAVVVNVVPKDLEEPNPAFEPVAVRRGKTDLRNLRDTQQLRDVQRRRKPNTEDLQKLRQVWSGGRFAAWKSFYRSARLILVAIMVGFFVLILAGAYRSFVWRTSRWDSLEDRARSDAALQRFRAERTARREKTRLDS
jgi:hypothetical protein